MSKRITVRPLAEINSEYAHLCAQLGENRYRITKLELVIKQIMNRIDAVSAEALRAGQGSATSEPAAEPEQTATETTEEKPVE